MQKKIVDEAIKCGAEVIKHQTHIPEDEMSEEAKKIIPVHTKKNIYKIIKECALDEKEELELKKYVEKKKIIFLSTPFSRAAVDRLIKFKVKAFKIGSGECNNYPLISYIASFKKPVIISTGMNDLKSIKETVYPDFTISTCDFGLRISCTCPSATNRIESAELEKLTLIFERPGTTKGLEVRLWAEVGVIIIESTLGVTIGPPAEREYAVEPVGVEIISPSAL